jgi:hypothetical protein
LFAFLVCFFAFHLLLSCLLGLRCLLACFAMLACLLCLFTLRCLIACLLCVACLLCKICCFHGGDYEESSLVEFGTVYMWC